MEVKKDNKAMNKFIFLHERSVIQPYRATCR